MTQTSSRTQAGNQYLYGYRINLDERGEFSADVCATDAAGELAQEVYEIGSAEALSELIEDGFMRHGRDVAGLADYLAALGLLPRGSSIVVQS